MSPFLLSLGQDGGFVPYKERIKAYFDRWPGAMEKFEACWLKHMHAVVFFQHIWHARVCVCVHACFSPRRPLVLLLWIRMLARGMKRRP